MPSAIARLAELEASTEYRFSANRCATLVQCARHVIQGLARAIHILRFLRRGYSVSPNSVIYYKPDLARHSVEIELHVLPVTIVQVHFVCPDDAAVVTPISLLICLSQSPVRSFVSKREALRYSTFARSIAVGA
jgi:hypothetical protein